MVHTSNVTEYMVSYQLNLVVQLNKDMTVISHSLEFENETVECFVLGGEPGAYDVQEVIELFPNIERPEETDDYYAVVGNAQSYINGLTLVFGQGEDNDEPF